MEYIIGAIAGLAIGFTTAWLIATYRASAIRARENSELRTESESSRKVLEEVRGQLEVKEKETAELREKLREESSLRTSSEARLDEERKNLQEQRGLMEKVKKDLSDTFDALAGKALKSSSDEFIKLARETLAKVLESTKGELGEKQNELKTLVKPLQTSLEQYEKHVKEMEKSLKGDYQSIDDRIKSMLSAEEMLSKETRNLVAALRHPQVRGKWGELTLQRVVEVAGLSEKCDFDLQATGESEEERAGRPDMKVNLPGNRYILVDAKSPSADDFLKAVELHDEDAKEKALKQYARMVREHMRALSKKEYWRQFDPTPEYVVLFLATESFFSAALKHEDSLIEDGIANKIIIASPSTLIALLRTVELTWQQFSFAESARKIAEITQELFKRVNKIGSYFDDVGDRLGKAIDAYNEAAGSWKSRILPMGRKIRELGTFTESLEIREIGHIEKPLRKIPAEMREEEE